MRGCFPPWVPPHVPQLHAYFLGTLSPSSSALSLANALTSKSTPQHCRGQEKRQGFSQHLPSRELGWGLTSHRDVMWHLIFLS